MQQEDWAFKQQKRDKEVRDSYAGELSPAPYRGNNHWEPLADETDEANPWRGLEHKDRIQQLDMFAADNPKRCKGYPFYKMRLNGYSYGEIAKKFEVTRYQVITDIRSLMLFIQKKFTPEE